MAASNPVQNVSFPSNGGTAHGYLATPASGSGPGLVVLQEWWGLTSHVKDVTDRFAAEGFVAPTNPPPMQKPTAPIVRAEALAERIERESGVRPEFHQYPAGHAFFNDENAMGSYDKEQADLARSRTLEFLRANLG